MERALFLQIFRIHLKELPTKNKNVIQGPGENAGVDIGEDDAIVFKMKGHNHPSLLNRIRGPQQELVAF